MKIQSEEVRHNTLTKLKAINEQLAYLWQGPYRQFWIQLHHYLLHWEDPLERQNLLDVEAQLVTLPVFIETWIKTAVETPQTWEFFILTKAQEINSGDRDRDYFWALAIRRDQMVGLVRVLETLTTDIKVWVTKQPKDLVEDSVFLGLTEKNIEKQVYLEAEKVHRELESLDNTV